jgi:hypothetical protein
MRRGAVVKAKQIPKSSSSKGNLGSSVDYYAQDKNMAGEPQGELEAFTSDKDHLSPSESQDWLEQRPEEGAYTYRMTLSPGRSMGEDELKDWTRDVMSGLEDRKGKEMDYLAYAHNDPQHPHAHVILPQEEQLSNHDIEALREKATERAQEWEERQETIEADAYQHDYDNELNNEREHTYDESESSGHNHQQDELELELELD